MGLFILGMFVGMVITGFVAGVGQNNREHDIWTEGYYAGFEDGKATVEQE